MSATVTRVISTVIVSRIALEFVNLLKIHLATVINVSVPSTSIRTVNLDSRYNKEVINMKTINDIIPIMLDNAVKGCPICACQYCEKVNFCWLDTYLIASDYIEREGAI